MRPRGRPAKPIQGRGEIRADACYPISTFCRKLGISRDSVASARRRGLPVHFPFGRRCALIDGAEALAWLRSNPDQRSGDPQADVGNTVLLTETAPETVRSMEGDGDAT